MSWDPKWESEDEVSESGTVLGCLICLCVLVAVVIILVEIAS